MDIIIRGLSLTLDDQAVLDLTGNIFDGLYEYLRKGLILGREPEPRTQYQSLRDGDEVDLG